MFTSSQRRIYNSFYCRIPLYVIQDFLLHLNRIHFSTAYSNCPPTIHLSTRLRNLSTFRRIQLPPMGEASLYLSASTLFQPGAVYGKVMQASQPCLHPRPFQCMAKLRNTFCISKFEFSFLNIYHIEMENLTLKLKIVISLYQY